MDEKEKEALEKAKKEAQEAIEKMATEKAGSFNSIPWKYCGSMGKACRKGYSCGSGF